MGVEQDPRGSKLERVKKKKKTLFISNNKFFFKWRWVSREEEPWSESGAGGCEIPVRRV